MDRDSPCNGVEALLGEIEHRVVSLRARHGFLSGFESELRSATRDKTFAIWNRSVWAMVLDHRDMLISDLASLARATYGEDGLLGRLQAFASRFHRRRESAGDEPRFSGKMLDALHSNAFTRLFPACVHRHATASDFDGLASRYFDLARPITAAVAANRARGLDGPGNASMLHLEGIEAFLASTERMLNDLRLISVGSPVGFQEAAEISAHESQLELVDMILHGSLSRAAQLAGRRSRDALHAALHRAHAECPEDSGSLFNDRDAWTRLAERGETG